MTRKIALAIWLAAGIALLRFALVGTAATRMALGVWTIGGAAFFVSPWVVLGIALVIVWISSLLANGCSLGAYLFGGIALLSIYFIAEGMEYAYTDLRDKDEQQLSDPVLHRILQEMRNKEFVPAREWLVVLLVIIATYFSEFDKLSIPFFGVTEDKKWRLLFTLAITSLPIAWLAQTFPKELALRNSTAFLRDTWWAWPPLRALGRLMKRIGLFHPTELLLDAATRHKHFGEKRNLGPSYESVYVSSLKRYGYALHRIREEIEIRRDGSATFRRRSLIYVVEGARTHFTQHISFDAIITEPGTDVLRAYTAPCLGETEEELGPQLDSLFETGQLPEGFEEISTAAYQRKAVFDETNRKRVRFTIGAPVSLPEMVVSPQGVKAKAIALYWELCAEVGTGGFVTAFNSDQPDQRDYYDADFKYPCRRSELAISLSEDLGGEFADLHQEATFEQIIHPNESDRLRLATTSAGRNLRCDLAYPLPGAQYTVRWQVWPTLAATTATTT